MRGIITGAANGIGRALANKLATNGYDLVLIDIDETNLAIVAQELSENYGSQNFETHLVDITDEVAIADVCQKIIDLGPVHLLINNAGIGHYQTVAAMEPVDFKQQVAVNLLGAFNVAHGVLPALTKAEQGMVVNIGSRHSYEVAPERSAYCASKFGLRGWSLCLELELKDSQLKVTIIEPHSVVTNFNNALADKKARQTQGEIFLEPEQVAEVVSDLITGQRDWASEVRIELDLNSKELLVESLRLQ